MDSNPIQPTSRNAAAHAGTTLTLTKEPPMFSSPRLSNLSRLHLIALIFVCLFSETARAQDARDPLLGPPCTPANGCEVKEGWLEGPSGPFWAHYMLTDGQASIGDMLFSEKRDLSARGAISRTASLWPGGVIPFDFAAGWTDAQEVTIIGVINAISQQTVLTLRRRTTADANWVLIRPTTTPGVCGSSAVGRVGSGSQNLSLRASCLTNRTITHEFFHAAGLEHEHTRPDRNDFVNVDMTACTMGTAQCQVDYGRSTTTEAYGFGRYDFASILHYQANAVLTAKNGEKLGGNTLTPGDLADLAALYEPLRGYPYERDGSGSTYKNDDHFGKVVTVGDFNGDGFADFAAASKGLGVGSWQAEVTVVYGTAAGPSSANNSNIVFSDAISALASGDFNGDGIDDLAVGHNLATMNNRTQAGKVLILPGQASGFDCRVNGVYNRDCHSVQLNRSAKV
ncbi:MAG TPA: hypothetical protein EYQ54_04500, partial [Myxococcales bacterium]|nr:hypothetical protein [Myxococcales bacterium]